MTEIPERDGHTLTLHIEDGALYVTVNCPYAMDDEQRPCWPWDTERDEACPMPAPQDFCNYDAWVSNLDAADFLHESWSVVVGCEWEWTGDGPAVRLGSIRGLADRIPARD